MTRDKLKQELSSKIKERADSIADTLADSVLSAVGDKVPNLGCATTKELLDEIHARTTGADCIDLNYRTIDGDLWKRHGVKE
jgi:hypothetical protein